MDRRTTCMVLALAWSCSTAAEPGGTGQDTQATADAAGAPGAAADATGAPADTADAAGAPADTADPPEPCDDGNACTFDQPSAGGCLHGELPCFDTDPCTLDACQPATGCQHHQVYTCDDGDLCTDDACIAFVGCKHKPHVCANDNACATEVCKAGACHAIPVADGAVCESGACAAGVCQPEACPGGPWQRLVGGPQVANAESLAVLPDGSWLTAGGTFVPGTPNTSATWLVHVSAQGDVIDKSVVTPGAEASTILTLSGGDAILAGVTNTDSAYTGWLARITAKGQPLWQLPPPVEGWGRFNALVVDAEGQLVAGGWRGGGTVSPSGWLARVSGAGLLLAQTFPGGRVSDMAALPGGGLVLAGQAFEKKGRSSLGAWLARTDAAGSILWQKTLGKSSYDSFRRMLALPDGGLLLLGSTQGMEGLQGGSSAWLVRTDSAGNVVWMTAGPTQSALGLAVAAAADGFIIAGRVSSPGLGWLWRVDGNGKTVWQRALPGPSRQVIADVAVLPDGDLALAGSVGNGGTVSEVNLLKASAFLARTDPWGHVDCAVPCTALATCDDGDPCTADVCESPQGCVHLPQTGTCTGG